MERVRIVNTAPLIFLATLERLELLRLGAEIVYVPSTVLAELRVVPDEAVKAVENRLGQWLVERTCAQPPLLALAKQSVDPGEAEVIALALELGVTDVVLDDLDARRFARRNGLQPIGTLGLLLAAKRKGMLTAVEPEIVRLLTHGFRASPALVVNVLKEANEQPR